MIVEIADSGSAYIRYRVGKRVAEGQSRSVARVPKYWPT